MKLAAWMKIGGVGDAYVAGKLKVSSEAVRLNHIFWLIRY
mgnify:CR=1 FL=1